MTDLEMLVDMGFPKPRAELALKKTSGRKYITHSSVLKLNSIFFVYSSRCHRLA